MTQDELKKLSRKELLEILIDQVKLNEEQEKRIAELEAELEQKEIDISSSGTMAEALLKLSNVYRDVDKAAKEYVVAVKKKADEKAEEIIRKAEAESNSVKNNLK